MSQSKILLEAGTNELEVVEFYLEEDDPAQGGVYRGYYGVNVAKVLEIIRKPKITGMPEISHKCIMGAFNLRSHVIPLVDLSVWLGKKRHESEPPKVIVTEFNEVTTAFLVSGVNRIHRISWEAVEPPNSCISAMSGNSVTGVVKLEGRLVFLLDLERIVSDLDPRLRLRLDEAVDWQAGPRYRALVADDSTVIREMLKDLMQRANFDVESVNNGRDAWNRLVQIKLRAEDEKLPVSDFLHVMVADIEMPQMDGHALCKQIKEDPTLKQLPVILFSSLITDKLRHKGLAVGADEQIAKPEVTSLARHALRLIEARQKAGQRAG